MGLSFKEHGMPLIDAAACSGCGRCAEICPGEVLQIVGGKASAASGNAFGCIACGHCIAICPAEAVTVEGRGEISPLPFPAAPSAAPEQLEALLFRRRSVRRFSARPIEQAILERIITMAAAAPMGIPPHEAGVLVFDAPEKVRRLAEDAAVSFQRMRKIIPWMRLFMGPFMKRADREALKDFVLPLIDLISAERQKGRDAFAYGGAAALLFHVTPYADAADCQILATYAMLAAESFGLGTCMLGTPVMFNYDKSFKQKYGIPPENRVGVALTLGWPAVRFQRGVKRRLREVRWV